MEELQSSEAACSKERDPDPERRLHPRVPANLPVLIMAPGRIVIGRTENVSEGGLAVALTAPVEELPRDVLIALRLPSQGWRELAGEIVCQGPVEGVAALLRIRLRRSVPGRTPPERRRPRLSTGAARPLRFRPGAETGPGTAFGAELRALATLVYEQALNEPRARPLRSLVVWANQLRRELGVQPDHPASYRDFLRTLADLHHCTSQQAMRGTGRV